MPVMRSGRLRLIGRLLCKSSPYVLMEVVLPGGTICALLLYLYRKRATRIADGGEHSSFAPALAHLVGLLKKRVAFFLRPYGNVGFTASGMREDFEAMTVLPSR